MVYLLKMVTSYSKQLLITRGYGVICMDNPTMKFCWSYIIPRIDWWTNSHIFLGIPMLNQSKHHGYINHYEHRFTGKQHINFPIWRIPSCHEGTPVIIQVIRPYSYWKHLKPMVLVIPHFKNPQIMEWRDFKWYDMWHIIKEDLTWSNLESKWSKQQQKHRFNLWCHQTWLAGNSTI